MNAILHALRRPTAALHAGCVLCSGVIRRGWTEGWHKFSSCTFRQGDEDATVPRGVVRVNLLYRTGVLVHRSAPRGNASRQHAFRLLKDFGSRLRMSEQDASRHEVWHVLDRHPGHCGGV